MEKTNPLFQLCTNYLDRGFNCCEATLLASVEHFKIETDCSPSVASVFGGGFAGHGCTCGAVTATLMAIGLLYGRKKKEDSIAIAEEKATDFLAFCKEEISTIFCKELCGIDFRAKDFSPENADKAFEEKCLPAIEKILIWQKENL